MAAESSRPRNIAMVVAHGVGEAEPGYAVATLSNTLSSCAGVGRDAELRVRHLIDPSAPAQQWDRTFPVSMSQCRLASGHQLTLAELYWADLTKIGPSRMDAVLGFFRIIFEAHHFVDGMLGGRDRGSRLLRQVLLTASWMLRGPLIGLVISTAALLWTSLYVVPEWVGHYEALWFGGTLAVVAAIGVAILVWAIRRRDESWYDPVVWTALISAAMCVFFFGLHYSGVSLASPCPQIAGRLPDCRQPYLDAVYNILGFSWQLLGGLLLASIIIAIFVDVRARKTRHARTVPLFTAIGVVMLQFILWSALLGTALMPFVYRAEEVKGINEVIKNARFATEAKIHASAQRLLNVAAWDAGASEWIDRIAFGYGFNGLMIFGLLLVALITHLRRQWLAQKSTWDAGLSAGDLPRMVVGKWIVAILVALGTLQALYLLRIDVAVANLLGPAFASMDNPAAQFAMQWKRAIIASGWMATLSLPLLASTRVGNFVHIARDLIDHQYSRRRASMLTQLRKSRHAEHWPRRARIQGRFIALLEELSRQGKFDAVIFVMHSQGSVVAFDYLRDQQGMSQMPCGVCPDLVTIGSPLGHLYEHYFLEYANLSTDVGTLQASVGRWVNLYRIDDYIGREVAQCPGSPIHNEQLPRGGHTDYWREERLAHVLIDLIDHPHAKPTSCLRAARLSVPARETSNVTRPIAQPV